MRWNYIIAAALCALSCAPKDAPPTYGEAGRLNLPLETWEPVAVAASPDGGVYVADSSQNGAIQVFEGGLYLGGLGGLGREAGELFVPTDVATGPDGAIYVAEFGTSRVSVFDPEGEPRGIVGAGKLVAPFGVAVGPGGTTYVADAEAGGVFVFGADASLREQWGEEHGVGKAWDVACAADGRVAVNIADGPDIFVFPAEGGEPSRAAPPADGDFRPTELAFGPEGELFALGQVTGPGGVQEYYVIIYDENLFPKGRFDVGLTAPGGLAVGPGGVVYVADDSRHTVKIFRPGGAASAE
jgi:DNA-binding beta-propeller fold protein YncE